MNDRENTASYQKPIAAILTEFEYDSGIPFTFLQQLDEVGIHKVYILVSNNELNEAQNNKFSLTGEGEKKQTIIDYYKEYKGNPNIEFEIIDTGDMTNEKDKINYFLKHTPDDNLLNICFCKDQTLPWLGNKLFSSIKPFYDGTINLGFFEKDIYVIPTLDQRLSPEAADQLLMREINPILCYPKDRLDIMDHQAIFKCLVEIVAVKLQHDDSQPARETKELMEILIQKYIDAIQDVKKISDEFEQSHSKKFMQEYYPDKEHLQLVKKKMNAELAIPSLLKAMITVYRNYVKDSLTSTPTPSHPKK